MGIRSAASLHKVRKTILIFTVHKAASVFLHQVLKDLTRFAGLPYFSPNNDENITENLFSFPTTRQNNDPEYAKKFIGKQGCIGPVRRPVILDDLDSYDIILHLRDPRDGLTSMFFSYAYSHAGVKDSERLKWIAQGVDRFVLDHSADYFERYHIYCKRYVGKENVLLLTYEEMVYNFPLWIKKFSGPFSLPNKPTVVKLLQNKYKNEFTTNGENTMNHKRKIIPGDHKDKLKPATISFLNDTYKEILIPLGYL